MSKLKFRVVHFSGEDNEYPAEELNSHSPNTKGWQSARFCEYPQEVGFVLESGVCRLNQVQILSHQSKISTKIEIFMGSGHEYKSAHFKRLGFLTLDNNERSSFQARELKTVYIDHTGQFVKLVIHRCFSNKYNLFNQVGIVAINLLGSEEVRRVPGDGLSSNMVMGAAGGNAVQFGANALNDLSVDMNLDPTTASKLRQLSEAKARAIASEDYALAKVIKNVEADLKSMGGRLGQLDLMKRRAVENEDYDKAREFKEDMDDVRSEIEEKVRNIHIVGVTEEGRGGRGSDQVTSLFRQQENLSASPIQQQAQVSPASTLIRDDAPRKVEVAPPKFRGAPLNVDEIVVGGSSGGGMDGVREYPTDVPLDRPIKSKAAYDDIDDGQRGIGRDAMSGLGNEDKYVNEPDEVFAPGEHPLDGVPGIADIPHPEQLVGRYKEYADQSGITALLGDFRTKCLFSKVWALREAVLKKVRLMLDEGSFETNGALDSKSLAGLTTIAKIGAEDKIAQVLFVSLSFVQDLLDRAQSSGVAKTTINPLLEPVAAHLIEKLNDGGARIREAAFKGLKMLSASSLVGHQSVAVQTLRPIPAKQRSLWRPIFGRIQVVQDILDSHGLGGSFNTDAIMNFCNTAGAFGHSNGEVRDAVKALTVKLQAQVGTAVLEPYLKKLPEKQKLAYYAAFEGKTVTSQPRQPLNTQNNRPGGADKRNPPPARAAPGPQGGGGGGGDAPTPHQHTAHEPVHSSHENDVGGEDFTVCMFCGDTDKAWDEDAMDLHYWKDCPMLSACPSCSQVVEIAGLPEHLLEECDAKEKYALCQVTGLAIDVASFADWSESASCTAPPDDSMFCPLCKTIVPDSDELWREHLVRKCAKNVRRK